MGRSPRPRPKYLGRKFKAIRLSLDLSVAGMATALGYSHPAHISGFESGKREPPLPVLLRYAEVANLCLDVLVDDQMQLPAKLPARRRKHKKAG